MLHRALTLLVVLAGLALGPLYADAERPTRATREQPIVRAPVEPPLGLTAIPVAPTAAPAPARPAPPLRERQVTVRRGSTLASILSQHGLDAAAIDEWGRAVRTVMDPRRLRPGRELALRMDAGGRLVALRYEIDASSMLVVERGADGLEARRDAPVGVTRIRGIAGAIERDLWQDVVSAGAPGVIAASLTKLFAADVDFGRLRMGDAFRVLYETTQVPDAEAEVPGRIVGASIETRGRTHTAVYFAGPDGRGGYYGPDGEGLGRMMLRHPVQRSRITSRFSRRRFHPILRRWRPHLGVDFAAPRGTPVHATAAGRVTAAGWRGGLGRTVRIAHAGSLETTYGHLHRLAAGIRRGGRVERGQVIGYVGSTGLATGSHLHYALRRGGRYVDPLSIEVPRAPGIDAGQRPAFTRRRDAVTAKLGELGSTAEPVVVSLAPATGSEG